MPKARVFMGDVGSVLLGFVYAGLVVGLSHSLNDFVVLCAFLFPFYADELTTLYVRIKDEWMDDRSNPAVKSLFCQTEPGFDAAGAVKKFEDQTSWSASHVTLTATYEPGQRSGKWESNPLVWFSYDYPYDNDKILRNRRLAMGVTLHF